MSLDDRIASDRDALAARTAKALPTLEDTEAALAVRASAESLNPMRNVSSLVWLAGAAALIGGGGWLMTQGDAGAAAHKQRDSLAFPTHQRPADQQRETGRRTLPVFAAAQRSAPPAPAHDPLLVALSPDAVTALVFEAGTVFRAPVGEAMLACVGRGDRAAMDSKVRFINPTSTTMKSWFELAERVAFSDAPEGRLFLVQGKLGGVDITTIAPGATERAYGAPGAQEKLYDLDVGDPRGGMHAVHASIWRESLLLWSQEEGVVERALDRLDGGSSKLVFEEDEAYGEVYGIVGQKDLERMVPEEMRERVHDVAAHASVHVDAIQEVLLVADVEGSDIKQVEDLGKSLGAAMAVGRLEAKREGEDDLVRLMDLSRVRPYGDRRLRVEVAIPADLMTKSMAHCGGPGLANDAK